jgi:hypothetical protein
MKKDSPVNVEAEGNQWAYSIVALTLVLAIALGYKVGLAVGLLGIVLYYTVAMHVMRGRIRRRVHETALRELALWRKLWRFGGVALAATADSGRRCAAPEGNWHEFVRSEGRSMDDNSSSGNSV